MKFKICKTCFTGKGIFSNMMYIKNFPQVDPKVIKVNFDLTGGIRIKKCHEKSCWRARVSSLSLAINQIIQVISILVAS